MAANVAPGRRAVWSREELYERTGWRKACAANPDHEIIVIVSDAHGPFTVAALMMVHRERVEALLREGKMPFFRHGQVMHIRAEAA